MSNIQQQLIIKQAQLRDIQNIKFQITQMEEALEPFMDLDLSDSLVRKDMREILTVIQNLENKLTNKLAGAV